MYLLTTPRTVWCIIPTEQPCFCAIHKTLMPSTNNSSERIIEVRKRKESLVEVVARAVVMEITETETVLA